MQEISNIPNVGLEIVLSRAPQLDAIAEYDHLNVHTFDPALTFGYWLWEKYYKRASTFLHGHDHAIPP